MLAGPIVHERSRRSGGGTSARRWKRDIALAAAVGPAFFLLAKLGLGLPSSSGFVAVFWPAMGFGVGVLIGLGPNARWPVLAAITVANFLANLSSGDPPQIAAATCFSEATECLVPAVLVERWFGAEFTLARLRHVLGLLAAAVAGSAAGAVSWILASRLLYGATGPMPITFLRWFMSDTVGFITLGPFVIGLFAVVRSPPSRREIIEGSAALLALAVMIGIIIPLPRWLWDAALPITWLFPLLLWLTARCPPFFATAAVFLVSITVIASTVIGIGHFGDAQSPIEVRVLQAQATILFVALSAFVLAALFAEQKESEAQLIQSKMMLERERDNKLMNVRAITASIAHEIRQPLAAIAAQAGAALQYLNRSPPRPDEARESLSEIEVTTQSASGVLDGLRALFGKLDRTRQPVQVNEVVQEVLESLQAELRDRKVTTHVDLTAELPVVEGHRGQLQEVVFNLINNAVEAMDSTPYGSRTLRVRTERPNGLAIAVSVQDTGPGIDPKRLNSIFDAFATTKANGTGLGLAICRMIAEDHGGQLTARSDGKSGALFQFVLPIERRDAARAGE